MNKRTSILQMGRISSKTKLKSHFMSHRRPALFEARLDTEEPYIGVGSRPL